MSKNNADFKSKTISYFVKSLELNNITDYVKNHEPLASVLLSNIIEIYEIFEEEIFFLIKINFEDKYKHDLSEEFLKEFDEKLWSHCNGNELPSKNLVYKAFIKFSMRCLLADIDENQAISDFLVYRYDFLHENMENFLENLEEKLPKSIKVKHSLGNLFKKMNLEMSEKKKILYRLMKWPTISN